MCRCADSPHCHQEDPLGSRGGQQKAGSSTTASGRSACTVQAHEEPDGCGLAEIDLPRDNEQAPFPTEPQPSGGPAMSSSRVSESRSMSPSPSRVSESFPCLRVPIDVSASRSAEEVPIGGGSPGIYSALRDNDRRSGQTVTGVTGVGHRQDQDGQDRDGQGAGGHKQDQDGQGRGQTRSGRTGRCSGRVASAEHPLRNRRTADTQPTPHIDAPHRRAAHRRRQGLPRARHAPLP